MAAASTSEEGILFLEQLLALLFCLLIIPLSSACAGGGARLDWPGSQGYSHQWQQVSNYSCMELPKLKSVLQKKNYS